MISTILIMCSSSGPPSMLVTAVNSILSFVGIELAPAIEDSSKPVLNIT